MIDGIPLPGSGDGTGGNDSDGGGGQLPPPLFLAHLDCIERVIRWVVRRHRCSLEEAEEFAAEVRAKLVADNYAVLRSFSGRSRLETYLTVVIQNYFKDYRIHLWGRFRPSAEAQRLGKVAEKLEELRWKEKLTLDEAIERLLALPGKPHTRAALEKLAERLPERMPRRFQGEETLADLPAPTPSPAEAVLSRERRDAFGRAVAKLQPALAGLPPEDRLIVRMAFEQNLKVSDIARSLCLDQKRLYRRLDRIKKELRDKLEAQGVRWEDLGPGPEES